MDDMAPKSDLLQGTLDLMILRTLSGEPMHGWGISQRIQQLSKDVLQVNQGSLYPALQAKFYQLTRDGRKQLAEEQKNWERLSTAVARVLAGL
jgi:PadR family transcriptional regulator PadR